MSQLVLQIEENEHESSEVDIFCFSKQIGLSALRARFVV